jgi:hypothetical protein
VPETERLATLMARHELKQAAEVEVVLESLPPIPGYPGDELVRSLEQARAKPGTAPEIPVEVLQRLGLTDRVAKMWAGLAQPSPSLSGGVA